MNSLIRWIMAIILVVIGIAILGGILFIIGPIGLLVGLAIFALIARAYEFIGPIKYVGKNNNTESKK